MAWLAPSGRTSAPATSPSRAAAPSPSSLRRQIYLSGVKTMSRKVKETMLAVQIERNWPKKKILETYLNQVYFGSKAYGVQAAAQTYFGKNVWELNLPQCAMIAGLPQRPSKLNPYENMAAAKARRNLVLQRMADLNMVTPAEAQKAMKTPIRLAHRRAPAGTGFRHAPFFCNAILDSYARSMATTCCTRAASRFTRR